MTYFRSITSLSSVTDGIYYSVVHLNMNELGISLINCTLSELSAEGSNW